MSFHLRSFLGKIRKNLSYWPIKKNVFFRFFSNKKILNSLVYDSFRASPSNSLADVKDKIWNQLNGSDYLEKVFLRSRQNYENETRKIKKSDLRFKGVRAYSNELYEFRNGSKK